MTVPAIFLTAAVIAACGFFGGRQFPQPESVSFLGGALTLAGAFLICGLFASYARWHGIGGAAVIALAGTARNLDALPQLARAALHQSPLPPGATPRTIIAAACLTLFFLTARALLQARRHRQAAIHHPPSRPAAPHIPPNKPK